MDLKAASAIHDFMDTYPSAKDVKREVWELMLAAMGSDHADMWDKKQRADKLFFIELLGAFMDKFYEKYDVDVKLLT